MSSSNEAELLSAMQDMRSELKSLHSLMPDSWEKTAVEYYIFCGRAIDTATKHTIVDVITKLMERTSRDYEYHLGLSVLANRPGNVAAKAIKHERRVIRKGRKVR